MASNNVLSMREEELETAASGFSQCATDLGTAGSSLASKFSSATNCGLMGKTVGSISKEMSLISSSLANMQSIVTKQSQQMFSYDRQMAQVANEIEIPDDFLENNSMAVNQYNRTLLEKVDGKSVNEGQTATAFNEIDDYQGQAEKMVNISGDETKEQTYDDTTTINRSVLAGIVKDEPGEQEYDESTSINKEGIADISGNQTEEQTYDDRTSVTKENVADISGNQTQEQTYDDSTTIQRNNLSNMGSGTTDAQAFDGTTTVNRSVLAGINMNDDDDKEKEEAAKALASVTQMTSTKADENKKTYDDMMVQTQGMAAASLASMSASAQTDKTNELINEAIRRVDEQYADKSDE